MHIIIAFITAVVSLLWALDRFGVDIHSLNPFHWKRRREWKQKYYARPIHTLKRPLEAAAVLIVGIVKTEGMISREQKAELLDILRNDLKQDSATASDLFTASAFMLNDIMDIAAEVPQILAPCKELFSDEQVQSLLDILAKAASLEGGISPQQEKIILAVKKELQQPKAKPGEW